MKPHIRAKLDAWRNQADALGAEAYRLTMIPRNGGKPFNLGKSRDGQERFFSAEEVAGYIESGFLAAKNSQGYDIYVTPIADDRHYLVLDDSDEERLRQLQSELDAYPCWVQESSPKNLQAIFVAAKFTYSRAEQSAANKAVQYLNRRFGDPEFSGVIHPFRMAGFANAKPKFDPKKRPFVQPRFDVIETAPDGSPDPQIADLIEQYRQAEPSPSREGSSTSPGEVSGEPAGSLGRAFRDERELVRSWVEGHGWTVDESRLDYHAAGSLIRQGFDERDIAVAIRDDPDVANRHYDSSDYARRTVAAIAQDLANNDRSTHDWYWNWRRKEEMPQP